MNVIKKWILDIQKDLDAWLDQYEENIRNRDIIEERRKLKKLNKPKMKLKGREKENGCNNL